LTASSERRRPGLQGKWRYVVDSLESIIPIYESGSRRIALFSDAAMRGEVVAFAVRRGSLVLDLGSGPGTLSRMVRRRGGDVVLSDASTKMLKAAGSFERVQCVFETLPFRDGVFGAVVAGFALRDSRDLRHAVGEVRRILKEDGRFAFCDLGKPRSFLKSLVLGCYVFAVVPVIGLLTGGRAGLGFASLYQTYLLTLDNDSLVALLRNHFASVGIRTRQLGGSIVVTCSA
jgi:demethylmenaquinone methyltransferase / 2-methoxy-6-polyprenyl-1,4-benzoquinol methylase